MEKKNNGCGCGCFCVILIIILVFIAVIFTMYNMNSEKIKNDLNTLFENAEAYISEVRGVQVVDDNLVFPEEEKLTGAQKYFYYQQLSETAKKIYITIENNIDNLKNGMDNIPLPRSLCDDAKSSNLGKELIEQEFQNAWDAFITDRSEYFYLNSSKVCLVTKITTKGSNTDYEFFISKGDNDSYFTDEFNSLAEVELAIKKVENAKNEILKNAEGTNYQKVLYIHDWIIDNNKYDTLDTKNNNNIYGCLINKTSICEGYARTYKYLLDELNIPCILVSGTATDENGKSERHAWNYVYINNNWYAIDTTWDDPIIIGNGKITDAIKYKYFLKGKTTMEKEHETIGQITKNGIKFEYPELSIEDIQ